MSGDGVAVDGVAGRDRYELRSILAGEGRDSLINNSGGQVKISSLGENVVALYFSASWCGPCRRFTPELIAAYNDLSSKGTGFEVIFISADEDDDSFNGYFSKMPWLAIPFSDTKTREDLDDLFKVQGIPHLVIMDESGNVLTDEGVQIVNDHGSEGYPFTHERIKKLQEDEEAAKRDQTLRSILVSSSRDFLISEDGNKTPVSELEGKVVGLYFSISSFPSCLDFTSTLKDMYAKLKETGEKFEVVLISLDDQEESFNQAFTTMPWLAIPINDRSRNRLARYFELETIPTLVVIGYDGKTLHKNAAELVEEHGAEAYPFSPEKLEVLAEREKTKREAQTLESLLVQDDRDYVIGKEGVKVPVSDLVGRNILLYFSAHWCPPCRSFLPKLIKAYEKIKAQNNALEVIFISSDRDQNSFDEFFATMPWLALPFGDPRKKSLSKIFKVQGIPSLIAIGPTGRTVTSEARELVTAHGADAFPFTEERMKELEAKADEMAKNWPQKVRSTLHEEHELVLSQRRSFVCDKCEEHGSKLSFYCEECDFDLHPNCALESDKDEGGTAEEDTKAADGSQREGYVCDGEVCYKV